MQGSSDVNRGCLFLCLFVVKTPQKAQTCSVAELLFLYCGTFVPQLTMKMMFSSETFVPLLNIFSQIFVSLPLVN